MLLCPFLNIFWRGFAHKTSWDSIQQVAPVPVLARIEKHTCRMGKHHASEVRGSVKVAPKNSLTSLLRPRKNHAYNMLAFLDFKEVVLTKPLWVARIEKHTCWMGKLKIAPKNSLTSLPKPRKNVLFCLFFSYTWNLRNSNRNSYIPAAAGGNAW